MGLKVSNILPCFLQPPLHLCLWEDFCHVEIQSQPLSSSWKKHELAFSHFLFEIALASGETADCPTLPQLHKSEVTVRVEVCTHTPYIFWPPNGPVLCFVPLQGDAGPPGAEGEQGQEGVRVSHYKQPTNPFLPCVWVNVTRSFVYSPSLWWGCLIPSTKESRTMELFLSVDYINRTWTAWVSSRLKIQHSSTRLLKHPTHSASLLSSSQWVKED